MRIVAIHAIVFLLRASSQIPESVESTMDAVFVVFHLWAMALTAESHDVGEIDTTTIGQLQ